MSYSLDQAVYLMMRADDSAAGRATKERCRKIILDRAENLEKFANRRRAYKSRAADESRKTAQGLRAFIESIDGEIKI